MQLEEYKEGGSHIRRYIFSDVEDMVSMANQPAVAPSDPSRNISNPIWSGANSYEQAVEFALEGWSDGWEMMEQHNLSAKIDGQFRKRMTRRRSVAGGSIRIDKYLDGDPECMVLRKRRKMKQHGRIIDIFVSNGALCSVSGQMKVRRGIFILGLVNSLELSGFRCRIRAGCAAERNNCYVSHEILIKEPNQYLDKDRISFFLACPAFHRVFCFAGRSRFKDGENTTGDLWNNNFNSSMGSTIDHNKIPRGGNGDIFNIDEETGTYYLGVNNSDWKPFENDESMIDYFNQQLDHFGVAIQKD
jgi:hypothetical protein